MLVRQLKEAEVSPRLQMQSWKKSALFQQRPLHLTHTRRPIPLLQAPFTYLAVPVALILHRIGLVEFVLQLSDQIVLRVHDIQVLVLVTIAFVFLLLAGAADVIEDLPQLVTLG